MASWVLAVDFGTSTTVAALRRPDGRVGEVLVDGTPLLPSAVYADADGTLLTGGDAVRSARLAPERYEPNPKLRVDDGTVLLGAEIPVVRLVAAVLGRVAGEARRTAGGTIDAVVLTHPAGWGPRRRSVLLAAADDAGLGPVTLVAEPVAAARHLLAGRAAGTPPVVVYDLGAGTFDVSVVSGADVLTSEGLADAGGRDVDEALLAYLGAQYADRDPDAWRRLRRPATPADHREHRRLVDDVRAAKETLSRTAQAFAHVPLIDVEVPIGREQLDAIAEPLLRRTVRATRAAILGAGLPVPPPGPVYLVGGATRMPIVATMLHRELGVAPTPTEQPELVVAHGALASLPSADPAATDPVRPGPARPAPPGAARPAGRGPGHPAGRGAAAGVGTDLVSGVPNRARSGATPRGAAHGAGWASGGRAASPGAGPSTGRQGGGSAKDDGERFVVRGGEVRRLPRRRLWLSVTVLAALTVGMILLASLVSR